MAVGSPGAPSLRWIDKAEDFVQDVPLAAFGNEMEDVVENLGMVGSVVLKSRLASGPASPSHRPTHYDVSVDGDEHAAIRGARLDITSGQPEPHWWEALDACCQFASRLFFFFLFERKIEVA